MVGVNSFYPERVYYKLRVTACLCTLSEAMKGPEGQVPAASDLENVVADQQGQCDFCKVL